MTISYAGPLWKVLLRWKGSIWKACYIEAIIYIVIYFTVSAVYRLALKEEQKRVFEDIVQVFDNVSKIIPITFFLGFYVSTIISVSPLTSAKNASII